VQGSFSLLRAEASAWSFSRLAFPSLNSKSIRELCDNVKAI
jgi:hypothetical protein